MKTLKFAIFLFLSISHLQVYSQPGDMPLSQKPGKCYAKCIIPAVYKEYEVELPVYVGEDMNNENVIPYYLSLEDDVFVEDKSRNAFLSSEVQVQYDTIMIVVDTTRSDDYFLEFFVQKELITIEKRDWREVLCGDKVNSSTILDMQKALNEKGGLNLNYSNGLDQATKRALTNYQVQHRLPIGTINIETLKHLGLPSFY